MAKLYIKTLQNPYSISDKDAKEINSLWMDDSLPPSTKFSVGPLSFEKNQIKLIDTEFTETKTQGLDIDDPAIRQVVKDFEFELNGRHINQYLLDEKITTKQPPPYIIYGDAIVRGRENNFSEAWNKWSALGTLKRRRQFAQKQEELDKENLINKFSDEINVKDIPF